jgi:Tuberculosis necrotizing toxin
MGTRAGWRRKLAAALAAGGMLLLAAAAPAGAAAHAVAAPRVAAHEPAAHGPAAAGAAAARARPGVTGCSAASYQGDPRLGPARLPDTGRLGLMLTGYRRLGGMPAQAFLAVFWGHGSWHYPPKQGYVLDVRRQPDVIVVRLTRGLRIDRFGPPAGSYLSPYGTPLRMRALPPDNLDSTPGVPASQCNYYAYRVLKAFDVDAGPVARWFRQPGYGFQYHLNGYLLTGAPPHLTVSWLVSHRYLGPLAP